MYKVIVFDWDGTLMDSAARIVGCLQAAARFCDFPTPSDEQAREIIGLGLREAMIKLFPGASEQHVQQLSDEYRREFLGDTLAHSKLFSGVERTLDMLLERDYFLAVATGKSRRGLEMELASSGLANRFDTTRCADETFSKPHPQMLEDILDRLGLEARDALVVGDTEYDVQMAINAGSAALGVKYGVHKCHRLLSNGALDCLASIDQLPGWLETSAENTKNY